MKKIVLSVIVLCLFLLSSCKIGNNDENGGVDLSKESFWGHGTSVSIVSTEEYTWLNGFAKDFERATGLKSVICSEGVSDEECRIIIGKSSNTTSVKAYQQLERRITEGECDEGYIVLVEGRTITIAYSGMAARDEAVSVLLRDYFSADFDAEDGILCAHVFDLKKLADERRAEQRESQFAKIEVGYGKGLADALRKLYTLYQADTYIWMANLYDPETGAFYFSNSGRDNYGFLPDVESTNQVLDFLEVGGMLKEQGDKMLTDEMESTLVKWIQSLQSPADGYFYHPQWGTDIETTRRSRDMDWSISLLERFGAGPLYDTPTGVSGINGAPGVVPISTPLRSRNSVLAVSNVLETASVALPSYLTSTEAFSEYILSLDIPNNSYFAGNKLAADHALIKKAGKEYVDLLINYLNDTQIAELGLWQRADNDIDYDPRDGIGYDSINGLMKIACVYDFLDREMPNADRALESTIKVALYKNTDEDEHACCTYNPWAAMDMLIRFESKSNGSASAEKLRKKILSVAEELVLATYEKCATHSVIEGGFSYNESRPCNMSQGAYTACSSVPEADVNATAVIASNLIKTMFSALGIGRVFLWCAEDFYVFRDIIENLGTPIKHELPEVNPITFDDYEKSEIVSGSELEPNENILMDIADFDYFSSTVVSRPNGTSSKDFALRTEVKNTLSGYAYKPSATNIYIPNSFTRGNCFIFESDILVESSPNEVFAQIMFAPMDEGNPSFSLNLSAVNKNGEQVIKIWDNYTGTDGVKNTNLYTGQKVGEWFKLRVEMYKVFEEDRHGVSTLKEIYAKIFVNGKYVATSDAGYVDPSSPGTVKNREVAKVYISHYRKTESVVYFDNILCKKADKEYVPTTVYNPDAPNIPDLSLGEGEDYNYVAEFNDGILNDGYLHNYVYDGGLVNVLAEDVDLEKYGDRIIYSLANNIGDRVSEVLKVTTVKQTSYGVSSSIVRVSNRLREGTTYTFESKFYYESVSERGCVTQLHFKDSDGRIHFSVNVMYSDEGYLYLSENNGTGTGQQKLIEGTCLPIGKWFTLKIEFYRTTLADTTRAKIYTENPEGTLVCIADINAYNGSAIGSETLLSSVEIAHQRLNGATLYLDDVSFTQKEIDYNEELLYPLTKEDVLPDVPDAPEQPSESDTPTDSGALTSDSTIDSGAWI